MHVRFLSDELKAQVGQKVYRLSLQRGCGCPNRDGTVGTGGCTFCSAGGSGEFAAEIAPLEEQIERAKELVSSKTQGNLFIAYFQSYTNTHGDLTRLRDLYRRAVEREREPRLVKRVGRERERA